MLDRWIIPSAISVLGLGLAFLGLVSGNPWFVPVPISLVAIYFWGRSISYSWEGPRQELRRNSVRRRKVVGAALRIATSRFHDVALVSLLEERVDFPVEVLWVKWSRIPHLVASGEVDIGIQNVNSVGLGLQRALERIIIRDPLFLFQGHSLFARQDHVEECRQTLARNRRGGLDVALRKGSLVHTTQEVRKTVVERADSVAVEYNTDMEIGVYWAYKKLGLEWDRTKGVDRESQEGYMEFRGGRHDLYSGGLNHYYRLANQAASIVVIDAGTLDSASLNCWIQHRGAENREEMSEQVRRLTLAWYSLCDEISTTIEGENAGELESVTSRLNDVTGVELSSSQFRHMFRTAEHFFRDSSEASHYIRDLQGLLRDTVTPFVADTDIEFSDDLLDLLTNEHAGDHIIEPTVARDEPKHVETGKRAGSQE